jgi:peptidoglycan/xylan/chitin deacetylase (PgdA/CDA1 family)
MAHLGLNLWPISKTIDCFARNRFAGRLAILIYHRVRNDADFLTPYDMVADQFDWQMELLQRYFNVISLHECIDRLKNGELPDRAVCITFDDGYSDQSDVALPILQKYGHKAAFFVPTGYINGGCMWNDVVIETIRNFKEDTIDLTDIQMGVYPVGNVSDKRETIAKLLAITKRYHPEKRGEVLSFLQGVIEIDVARDLMMGADKIRILADAGMEIGSHTRTHPILTSLDVDEARSEIVESKHALEKIINRPVRYFAYPNGKPYEDYMPEHVDIVRNAGFEAALSTAKGVVTASSDMFQLPRFTPWDSNPSKFILRLLSNYTETEPLVV